MAEALAESRLLWCGSQDAPIGCAIARVLARPSERTDYAQRGVHIAGGSVVCDAIASDTVDGAARMLQRLASQAGSRPVWVEAFEEDPIAKEALALLGFRYAATIIKAGSELKGLYALGAEALPAPLPPEERATQTLLAPAHCAPGELAELLEEVRAFGERWAQHYSSYNKRHSWTAVSLRGYSDDPNFIQKPAEMSRAWKDAHPREMQAAPRWTSAAGLLPGIRELVERLAPETDRVRLMRLGEGGELTRHADITDREAGVAPGRLLRLHIPLRTNPSVRFHGWDDRGKQRAQHFPAGSLFYLDQRKPHRVQNDGSEARVHVVIDAWSSDALRARLAEAAVRHGF